MIRQGGEAKEGGRTRIDEVLDRKAVFAYVSMRQCDDVFHSMTDKLFSENSQHGHTTGGNKMW